MDSREGGHQGPEDAHGGGQSELQPPEREVGRRGRLLLLRRLPGARNGELGAGLEVGDQAEVLGQLRLQGAAEGLPDRPAPHSLDSCRAVHPAHRRAQGKEGGREGRGIFLPKAPAPLPLLPT